jgi:hypothetical protein
VKKELDNRRPHRSTSASGVWQQEASTDRRQLAIFVLVIIACGLEVGYIPYNPYTPYKRILSGFIFIDFHFPFDYNY